MTTARTITIRLRHCVLVAAAVLLLAGCGDDPAAIGPAGIDGGLSSEGQRQEYTDGVSRALGQLAASTQGETFARAVDTANRKQLQLAALSWRQGLQQLKGLNPPKDAVEGHKALIAAVEALDRANTGIVNAAPNKAKTRQLAQRAASGPASQQFEAAVCQLVDAGYEVVDQAACSPLETNASPPVG